MEKNENMRKCEKPRVEENERKQYGYIKVTKTKFEENWNRRKYETTRVEENERKQQCGDIRESKGDTK